MQSTKNNKIPNTTDIISLIQTLSQKFQKEIQATRNNLTYETVDICYTRRAKMLVFVCSYLQILKKQQFIPKDFDTLIQNTESVTDKKSFQAFASQLCQVYAQAVQSTPTQAAKEIISMDGHVNQLLNNFKKEEASCIQTKSNNFEKEEASCIQTKWGQLTLTERHCHSKNTDDINPDVQNEWRSILGDTRPEWFKKLSPIEQKHFKFLVEKEQWSVLCSSTVSIARNVPGLANTSEITIDDAALNNKTVFYRLGVLTPTSKRNPLSNSERERLALINAKQFVQQHKAQWIQNFCTKNPNPVEKTIYVDLKSLLTPAFYDFFGFAENNTDLLKPIEKAIQEWNEAEIQQDDYQFKFFSSLNAVNGQRPFLKDEYERTGNTRYKQYFDILGFKDCTPQDVYTRLTGGNKENPSIPLHLTKNPILSAALVEYTRLLIPKKKHHFLLSNGDRMLSFFFGRSFSDSVNEEARLAALESIMLSETGHVSAISCKSSLDRAGVVIAHIMAYRTYWTNLSNTEPLNEEKFKQCLTTCYQTRHAEKVADFNVPGSEIKNEEYVATQINQKFEKNPMVALLFPIIGVALISATLIAAALRTADRMNHMSKNKIMRCILGAVGACMGLLMGSILVLPGMIRLISNTACMIPEKMKPCLAKMAALRKLKPSLFVPPTDSKKLTQPKGAHFGLRK